MKKILKDLQVDEIVLVEWGGSLEYFYVLSKSKEDIVLKMLNLDIIITAENRKTIRTGKFHNNDDEVTFKHKDILGLFLTAMAVALVFGIVIGSSL